MNYRMAHLSRTFTSPTDHYCEELAPIDEQICGLVAKRKEVSKDNPGFPKQDLITEWSQQYNLEEEMLHSLFSYMYHERRFVPPIEPSGFVKFVPILKSLEVNDMLYAVTHMKQYSNASVVYIETEVNNDEPFAHLGHAHFELTISAEYQCRTHGGCGQRKGILHTFVVTPPLPDDLAGIEFSLSVKPFPQEEFKMFALEETSVTIR